MERQKQDNLLEIFVKVRTVKALDRATAKSRVYQATLERQDKAFDRLKKAGLDREQYAAVDRAVSAANDCGAVYGAVAYRLGLYDGIRLTAELRKIK